MGKIFKISMKGLHFNLEEDVLIWVWPWVREELTKSLFSENMNRYFSSTYEYWRERSIALIPLNTSRPKVVGLKMEHLIGVYVNRYFPKEFCVSLHDMDPYEKSSIFWKSLPREKALALIQDVSLLMCKDEAEVRSLCLSIDPSFATAIGWKGGEIIKIPKEEEVDN